MTIKTIHDFYERFNYYYLSMLDRKMKESYELVKKGDALITKMLDAERTKRIKGRSLVRYFVEYRGDPLTSDREVEAFYRAYMYFKDHGWTVVDDGKDRKSPWRKNLEKAGKSKKTPAPFGL